MLNIFELIIISNSYNGNFYVKKNNTRQNFSRERKG